MTGPPLKRLKREEYRRAREDASAVRATTTATGEGSPAGTKGQQQLELPKKKFYRQRAHANPFSDHALSYPPSPSEMDWSSHFPAYVDRTTDRKPPVLTKPVEFADIGCGFGGLLVALGPLFPDTLMIGMELRTQVLEYVTSRIAALRSQSQSQSQSQPPSTISSASPPASTSTPTPAQNPNLNPDPDPNRSPTYENISALRSNSMKFLPNFFMRGQLRAVFLAFPDPHFKARKHKARIVSAQLNAEYAYVVRPGGSVFVVTDVADLFAWVERHFDAAALPLRPRAGAGPPAAEEEAEEEEEAAAAAPGVEQLWERVSEAEIADQQSEIGTCVAVMVSATEEGKKVERMGGKKFVGVWRRRLDPPWPVVA